MLGDLGQGVIEANAADEALRQPEDGTRRGLLVTDGTKPRLRYLAAELDEKGRAT